MCKHSRKPGPCSQCSDVKPRIVTLTDTAVLVDGVKQPERPRAPFAGRYGQRG